jgi:hypothetical protein
MVDRGFLANPEVLRWLNGIEPAWTMLEYHSHNALHEELSTSDWRLRLSNSSARLSRRSSRCSARRDVFARCNSRSVGDCSNCNVGTAHPHLAGVQRGRLGRYLPAEASAGGRYRSLAPLAGNACGCWKASGRLIDDIIVGRLPS